MLSQIREYVKNRSTDLFFFYKYYPVYCYSFINKLLICRQVIPNRDTANVRASPSCYRPPTTRHDVQTPS